MNVLEKILEELEEMRNIIESTVAMNCFGKDCEHNDCTVCVCKRAMEIVRSHMDEMNDDWIPCSERLPEDGTYLCTLDGELIGEQESFTGMCGIENGKWDDDGCVIAWQPLPEPYRAADKPDWKENMLNTFLAGH